jgi:lipoprotein-anchoring transpeptidase ErfK/SrfK
MKMQIKKYSALLLLLFIPFILEAAPDADSSSAGIKKEVFEYFTNAPEVSDNKIESYLRDQFPIISDRTVKEILNEKKLEKVKDTATKNEVTNVSFTIPENYLVDTAKILWELNIPEFQSRLYQFYKDDTILIDIWKNVIGAANSKTYTGEFAAYKIRNWPSWKDPSSPETANPEPPGPNNPLGLFVVHYDENSRRYFHGTNKPAVLNNKLRNVSHGCVRNDNNNIEKMKQFIIKRIVKSKDLSGWLNSKKSLIYEFKDSDKFPVRIKYKTYDVNKDENGAYLILFKDVYSYSNPKNIDTKLNDPTLITLSTPENIIYDYRQKFGSNMDDEALSQSINYILKKGAEYEKYYFEDVAGKFSMQIK